MTSASAAFDDLLLCAVHQSPAAILISDLKGSICFVNEAFSRHTGYPQEEILGKNPRILQSGLTAPDLYKTLWKTLSTGGVWQGELCNKTKAGKIFWESIVISPLRNAEGETTHFLAVWVNITDKKFEEGMTQHRLQSFQHDSMTDPLTGLYNRRHLMTELAKELDRAARYKRPLSGLMLDLDDFKKINDEFGHLAGDTVLKEAALIMRKSIRSIDVLGRYGGDEFLVFLPECAAQNANVIAERILKNIREHPFNFAGHPTAVTSSLGVFSFKAGSADDKLAFLDRMDQALLAAKKSGKNRIYTL